MQTLRLVLVLAFCLPAFATQREVGSGQTHATIAACITAASGGDICNVHAGSYSANVTISKAITIQNNTGDSPAIVGLVDITSDNVTFKGFDVSGTCSSYYIHSEAHTGLTISNNKVHGCTTGAGIYVKNSTNSTISGNESYANAVGIELISAHSTDATYAHGIQVLSNNSHDNNTDGMELHAQYMTIAGNAISDNIDTNWSTNHPDGIQLLAGTSDALTSVQHVLIYNNTIRNQTQNIFSEGTSCSQSSDTQDIWIFNNVVYNTMATVNGVNMATLGGVNAMLKCSRDVYLVNNTFGDIGSSGNSVHVQSCYDGSIHVQNNSISNSVSNGVYVEDPNDIASGQFDYDSYFVSPSSLVVWNASFYSTLAAFKSAVVTEEQNGISGNPNLGPFPLPIPSSASSLVGAGVNLTGLGIPQLDLAANGSPRPSSGPWTIGAFNANVTASTFTGKTSFSGKTSIN